jgi:hypothetical protein
MESKITQLVNLMDKVRTDKKVILEIFWERKQEHIEDICVAIMNIQQTLDKMFEVIKQTL